MAYGAAQIRGVSGKNTHCQCPKTLLRISWIQNHGVPQGWKVRCEIPYLRQENAIRGKQTCWTGQTNCQPGKRKNSAGWNRPVWWDGAGNPKLFQNRNLHQPGLPENPSTNHDGANQPLEQRNRLPACPRWRCDDRERKGTLRRFQNGAVCVRYQPAYLSNRFR